MPLSLVSSSSVNNNQYGIPKYAQSCSGASWGSLSVGLFAVRASFPTADELALLLSDIFLGETSKFSGSGLFPVAFVGFYYLTGIQTTSDWKKFLAPILSSFDQ
jgi:hypothetical protein